MRDVILVRSDASKVKVSNPQMGQFDEPLRGGPRRRVPIDVDAAGSRSTPRSRATRRRKGAKFHFVNTHLEAFGDPAIREAQARELFAPGGPLRRTSS